LLSGLGSWNRRYGEALFGALPGLPPGHVNAPTTLSADRKKLYVFIHPYSNTLQIRELLIKGIKNRPKKVSPLGKNAKRQILKHQLTGGASWYDIPGLLWVDISAIEPDPIMNVIKLEFDSPIDLYRGASCQFSLKSDEHAQAIL
jgi:alpha-L-fucosidase